MMLKSIWKSQSEMSSEYLQNLEAAEVERAVQYVDPWACTAFEALSNRIGNQVNSTTEKEEMLRLESFI